MKKKILLILILIAAILLPFIFKSNIIDFFNSVKTSFNRTIIDEKRYILILNGLKYTVLISLLSIILGTILGFLLFISRKIKIFKIISDVFIKLMQGTPITVLLLIFYYVIFSKVNIDPIIVAIITFSIYFSAYTAEIFRGAYLSLNKSQVNSAYALGFSKLQTLRYIILPQVLVYIIPVFKNQSVSLIKLTSICGYISIMELTKASDIIRNRTYEPFFPLILTALIYFIICLILGKTLDYIYKKINHRVERKYAN